MNDQSEGKRNGARHPRASAGVLGVGLAWPVIVAVAALFAVFVVGGSQRAAAQEVETLNLKVNLTVYKVCIPADDPGKFKIYVNDVNKGEIGCGRSLTVKDVSWDYTVREEAGSNTDLADYSTTYSRGCHNEEAEPEITTLGIPHAIEKTCTITNERLEEETGSLAVLKACEPEDVDGQFTFNLFNSEDDLIGSDTVGCGETATFTDIPAGSGYYVEEVPTEGFTETGNTCTNVTIVGERTRECTITNTPDEEETGSLAVLKACEPEDVDGEFTFNLFDSGDELIDSATVECGETATFTDLPAGGGYYVEEEPTEGFTETGNTCTNETVIGGQTASCTITNTPDEEEAGSLAVLKTCTDGEGEFTFNLFDSGDVLIDSATVGCGETATFTDLPPGSGYYVEEEPTDGFTETGNTCTNETVVGGETASCTITNTPDEEELGSIAVFKDCFPDADAQADFTFTLYNSDDEVVDSGTVGCGETATFTGLEAGGYYVLETDLAPGYEQTASTCDDIELDIGEDFECSISNELVVEETGSIDVLKACNPGADTTVDFTFTLYDADDSVVDSATVGCEETASFLDLPAGDYYVLESGIPDTFTQFDTNCDAITVDPGGDESCTITNIEEEEVIVEPSAPQTIVIVEAQPPAAPVEQAPVAEVQGVSQVITPPNTGDGGLADSEHSRSFTMSLLMLAGVTGLVTALSVARLRHLKRR